MSYTPVVRWRNFTLENLKSMLDLYPDLLDKTARSTVADTIETSFPGYKKTAYQFGCQLGIESRAEHFSKQNYLYFLSDAGLEKYLGFWFKMYVCPNPYVNSSDAPICPFTVIAQKVLESPDHKISYTQFCNEAFGEGKSIDIFRNALVAWGKPLSVIGDTISIAPEKVEELKSIVAKVNSTLPMKNNKDVNEFFERFACEKFMSFYDLTTIDNYSNGKSVASAEIVIEDIPEDLSLEELGTILKQMYEDQEASSQTNATRMFAIKYGKIIEQHGYNAATLVAAAGLKESYHTEVNKGINIYRSIKTNEYGVRFHEQNHKDSADTVREEPPFFPRTSKIHPLNSILYGAPGTGKTYITAEYALAILENREVDESPKTTEQRKAVMEQYRNYVDAERIVFTTFHQSYGYEDFIQGLRPVSKNGGTDFVPIDGVFKRIADNAKYHPENNYVIIIDEINRANISKVFGELITLIEDDKRWGEVNSLQVTLPSGQPFKIPNNLYIVGTMNSADKSISLIDTALRRRFEFIEVTPNASLIADPVLRSTLEKLNTSLAKELDSTDLLVGHAYFIGKTEEDLCSIFNRSIIPLLYEYFYDNSTKVKAQIKNALPNDQYEITGGTVGRIKISKK